MKAKTGSSTPPSAPVAPNTASEKPAQVAATGASAPSSRQSSPVKQATDTSQHRQKDSYDDTSGKRRHGDDYYDQDSRQSRRDRSPV